MNELRISELRRALAGHDVAFARMKEQTYLYVKR